MLRNVYKVNYFIKRARVEVADLILGKCIFKLAAISYRKYFYFEEASS